MAERERRCQARSQARSIEANLRIEGQSLTSGQLDVVEDILASRRDAEDVVREHKAALASHVRHGR